MEGYETSPRADASMLGLRLALNSLLRPTTTISLASLFPVAVLDRDVDQRSRREGNGEVRSTPPRYVKQDYVLVMVRAQYVCGCADTGMGAGHWTCVDLRERHLSCR